MARLRMANLAVSLGVTQLLLVGAAGATTIAHKLHGKQNKEAVVLIHGFTSTQATWGPLAEKLSKRYQVLVYDQPGHGLSPADGEDYSPDRMARFLNELLDEIGLEKVHVVGHSMGGRTAVKFASLFPERVSSLAVEDMHLSAVAEAKKQLPAARARYRAVRDGIPATFPSLTAARAAFSKFYNPIESYLLLSSAKVQPDGSVHLTNRPEVTHLYLGEGLALDMTEELKSIRCPMTFFAADPKDSTAVLKGEGLDHIRATRPDALIRVFPGAGHKLHDRPDFFEALSAFLAA